MKRMQLFEFEDQPWFPDGLRVLMTRFLVTMHRLMGTRDRIVELLERALARSEAPRVFDLCSGHGGPMAAVLPALRARPGLGELDLTLSDLYPNAAAAEAFNSDGDPATRYLTTPVDATAPGEIGPAVRTMICSLHHMPPDVVRRILTDAAEARQPFLAFEISDNSFPKWLWWAALPPNVLMVLAVTPFIRPMTWQQLVFTYLVPVLPFLIAWDGTVSNARTYTREDLAEVLRDVPTEGYTWETGVLGKGPAKPSYILGLPVTEGG